MFKQRLNTTISTLTLFVICFCCTKAQAEIELNGFASIRATSTTTDGGAEPYVGFKDGELTFKPESLFALQARTDLGEGLSATVQFYADGVDNFDAEARWAYISYELNDQHKLNAGLLANPMFHQSEYEKVGYAHNFARLPTAVYIGFEFSTVEGISLDSQYDVGGLTLQTKFLYGNWDGDLYSVVVNDEVPFGISKLFAANLTLIGDWWQLFAGAFVGEIEGQGANQGIVFPLSQPGITAALAAGATQADIDEYKMAAGWDNKDAEYWFSGFAIDYENWLVDFEYVNHGIKESTGPMSAGWYAAVGHRLDSVVITLHTEDFSRDQRDYDFLAGVEHPILIGTGQAVENAFSLREFDGTGLTVRWDFHPSAALKVDYFRGTDTRPTVGDYSVASVGVDLVF